MGKKRLLYSFFGWGGFQYSVCIFTIDCVDRNDLIFVLFCLLKGLVVLDRLVMVIARRYRADVPAASEENDYNRNNRHAAYRQFFLWTHGYLGAGIPN